MKMIECPTIDLQARAKTLLLTACLVCSLATNWMYVYVLEGHLQ